MSNPLMVGYLESWGSITFTQAAEAGYNCIVMAFGSINGDAVDIYNGSFAPSSTPSALKEDIKGAKSKGAKEVLFSVGGANNTYNPGNTPVSEVATSINKFIKEYKFTGIDFDLEIDGDGVYLAQLCKELKKQNPSITITSAPQINQLQPDTDLYLVSTAHIQMYNEAIKDGSFDYLFVQNYNNPNPKLGNCTETTTCFISEAFKNLKKCVPENTLITMGLLASKEVPGTSIFTATDDPEAVYKEATNQYKAIRDDNQFGGAMCWDINWDQKNGYMFINTIKPSI